MAASTVQTQKSFWARTGYRQAAREALHILDKLSYHSFRKKFSSGHTHTLLKHKPELIPPRHVFWERFSMQR